MCSLRYVHVHVDDTYVCFESDLCTRTYVCTCVCMHKIVAGIQGCVCTLFVMHVRVFIVHIHVHEVTNASRAYTSE